MTWLQRAPFSHLALFLLFCVAAAAPAFSTGKPTALLSDLRGKGEVQIPGGDWKSASIMTFLPIGSKLRLGSGAKATVSLMKGGTRWILRGPATIQVEADSVKLLQGVASGLQSQQAGARTAVLLPANVDIQRMGGVQSRGGPDLVLAIDDTIDQVRPVLTWSARETYDKFELSIVDELESETVYSVKLPGSARQAELPAESALQYGQQYSFHLLGVKADGKSVEAAPRDVEVLEKDTAARVQAATQEAETQYAADPEDVSPLVLLMSVYAENSMTTPALKLAQRVSQLRPDDKTLYLFMGKLYERQQDKDKAAEMYRKAGP